MNVKVTGRAGHGMWHGADLRLNRATLSAASAAALLNRPAPSAATGTAFEANQAGPLEAVSKALPTYVFSLCSTQLSEGESQPTVSCAMPFYVTIGHR